MARDNFIVEKGLQIVGENLLAGVTILFGSGAPGGDTGAQDAAEIGSIFLRTDSPKQYQKQANAGAAADWKVVDITNVETALGIADDASDMGAFTGNILTDNTTAVVLFQELETSLDNTHTSLGISNGDTDMGTYTGSVLTDDTTQVVLNQEIETSIDNTHTSLGISNGDSDMGVYTGPIITDNTAQTSINQELSDAIESGVQYEENAVTSEISIADFLVDDFLAVEIDIHSALVSDRSKKDIIKLFVSHDGHVGADASATDDTVFAKLKFGGGSGLVVSTDVNLTGAAQVMRVRISASAAVDVNATLVGAIKQ